ncbi:hypothetical protein NEIRO03_0026 [Nematocida sp. AWRm78]|nr:hypothetical protein NEIRO02_0159 [Nematocida sp. AWRm79]KAI5182342.1 hypothetical protein NEIRO03_0026 [Nematocida sp. AWRm78]
MDEDLLLSFSDGTSSGLEETAILKMNREMQNKLHEEYLDIMSKLDVLVILRKQLTEHKKKTKKKRAPSGLKKPVYQYLTGHTDIETNQPTEGDNILAQINAYFIAEKVFLPNVKHSIWPIVSKHVGRPVIECMELWYHPRNPAYRQDKFQPEEDKEIKKNKENWEETCKTVRRAPISVYSRYLELEGSKPTSQWTEEEDLKLTQLVQSEGKKSWTEIATDFENKTAKQCMYRYKRVLNPIIKHGKWSKKEDEALLEGVRKHKKGNWKEVCKYVPSRTQFQCRERFVYYLDPARNNSPWTPEEDEKLLKAVNDSKKPVWSKVAKELTGRTDRQCRIRYFQINRNNSNSPEATE